MSKNVKIFLDKSGVFIYNAITTNFTKEAKFMNASGLMTIDELAIYLKVTRRTIYDWLKHNKIPALKLVGQWRFKRDKIDAWLDTQSQPH
jgi:excisionase family DNA binding protein